MWLHIDYRSETLWLPVSKTDPAAILCRRTWDCVSTEGSCRPCPYHSAVRLRCSSPVVHGAIRGCTAVMSFDGQWTTEAGCAASLRTMAVRMSIMSIDQLERRTRMARHWRHAPCSPDPSDHATCTLGVQCSCGPVMGCIAHARLTKLTAVNLDRLMGAPAPMPEPTRKPKLGDMAICYEVEHLEIPFK